MSNDEFLITLLFGLDYYFLALLVALILMLWIIKKNYNSILDPLFFTVIFTLFANTIPIFLYFNRIIEFKYFIYFLISEFLFWSVFTYFINKKIKRKYIIKYKNEDLYNAKIYNSFILIIAGIFVLQLKTTGFAIFQEDRLGLFANSKGLGIISHIIPVVNTYLIIYSYYLIDKSKKIRLKPIIVLIGVGTYLILGGARSSLMLFVIMYFFYKWFYKKEKPSKKVTYWLCIFAGMGALYIFSFKPMGQGFQGTMASALFRFVASGDIYWMTYPNAVIEDIQPSPWYIDLFSNILYPLRLLDYNEAIPGIGTQAVYINMPEKIGAVVGANSRPAVWGYVMFGWWGLGYSVLWGWCLASLMRWATNHLTHGLLGTFIASRIYSMCLSGLVDPGLFSLDLFDNIVGLTIMAVIIVITGLILHSKKYEQTNSFN